MNKNDAVRKSVSAAYADAVSRSSVDAGGCGPAHKGVAVKLAGYHPEELAALPPEAVVNAFGCGNPLAFSEVRPGDVVLDLGSGAGIDILIAGRQVGATGRVIGIDMTDEMIAKARQNIIASGLANTEVRKGVIEQLPVESSSVDWVISNCVINLSPEKERVFGEIARVLRPGGRLRVSDLVLEDPPDWVRQDADLHSSCIGGAVSMTEYVAGLHRAGLVDIEAHTTVVYDAVQLAALVQSEGSRGEPAASACCARQSHSRPAHEIAEALVGKVRSVNFYARKPAA